MRLFARGCESPGSDLARWTPGDEIKKRGFTFEQQQTFIQLVSYLQRSSLACQSAELHER